MMFTGNSSEEKNEDIIRFAHNDKVSLERAALSDLKPYTEEYGKEILRQFREDGFEVDTIPYYSLPNVSKSFSNYKMGTMQSNFYVWYFSELKQPDNIIPELAEVCPGFVQVVSDAVSAREHKGIKLSTSSIHFLR